MTLDQERKQIISPLVLVVGMHRSGTSLLGSLLPACGITMPGTLIKGDHNNPEGYYERSDISDLQEQLLIDLERWWPSAHGMLELPKGWLQTDITQQATKSLSSILQQEYKQHSTPWAIKDPRTSLLLPMWRKICRQLKIPLRILLAVRDPREVMVSLVQRDQVYTGMDAWRAQQLWWRHNAQVIRDCQGLPFNVVSYSNWFDPETADLQLQQLAPAKSDLQRQQARTAIRPQHRRSHRQSAPVALHPSVQSMYHRLHAAALEPEPGNGLLHWLEQHSPPPSIPPAKSKRFRLRRWWNQKLHKDDQFRGLNHPWAYFASMRIGSEPEAIQKQIKQWMSNGFNTDELKHAAALPGTAPIAATPTSSANSTAYINEQNIEPGKTSIAQLLTLVQQPKVFDRDRQRVILLRQFGINAVWLAA